MGGGPRYLLGAVGADDLLGSVLHVVIALELLADGLAQLKLCMCDAGDAE